MTQDQAELAALRNRLAEIENSAVWRAAAPLHHLVRRSRPARLLAWLLTGQVRRPLEHWAARRLVRNLVRHGLFDAASYVTQPGAPPPGPWSQDPLAHYALAGHREGLRPNPLFDPAWYAARAGIPLARAIHHFLGHLAAPPHPLFDPAHYTAAHPEAAANPLGHYLATGAGDPNPDFDAAWYRARYAIGTANPLVHFLTAPATPGRPRETNGRRAQALRAAQARALGTALPRSALAACRLAVGIVAFRTPQPMLDRVLRSIRIASREAGIEPRLLLIDNSGEPHADPGLDILPSIGNVGFGGGHNCLMRHAFAGGATAYLALNPDAALHPGALLALLRMSLAAGNQALVQALQFPAEHTVPYDPATFETPWVSGACLLIPRPVHDRIGGFDEGFFMYCEDVDLSWRARAAGLRTLTCPEALLFHPTTNRILTPDVEKMFLDSGLRLGTKWGGTEFGQRIRDQHFPARGLCPPDLSDVVPEPDRSVADFSHGFSFGPVRW